MRTGKSKKTQKRRQRLYFIDDPNIQELEWLDDQQKTEFLQEESICTVSQKLDPVDETTEILADTPLAGEIEHTQIESIEPILVPNVNDLDDTDAIARVASFTEEDDSGSVKMN